MENLNDEVYVILERRKLAIFFADHFKWQSPDFILADKFIKEFGVPKANVIVENNCIHGKPQGINCLECMRNNAV